jgi:hypothetical protein
VGRIRVSPQFRIMCAELTLEESGGVKTPVAFAT